MWLWRTFKFVIFGTSWGMLNLFDKDVVKKKAFEKGQNLSFRFKKYKTWDEVAEPIIIRQFAFLFGVSNSFIKGLISDNEPDKNIDKSLEELCESCEYNRTKDKQ